ncbi:MAG: hypothetical protein JXR37_27050 [Kiritimatiellae bacterium]|nr:hypothetical protein [Kiritimatiellia bacterium]
MDKKDIVKKLLLRPIDWITLAPFLAGATLGLAAWAINLESGVALAASVILILLSAGIYLHRLLIGWNEDYERLLDEWRQAVEKNRDRELDRLYAELRKDGDPRTEALLKDLRTLTKALMSEQSESLAASAFDIVADVDKLFQRSVDYLKESLQLWRTAEAMQRETIKDELLKHREILIEEVEKSLENLGDVLGRMKKAAVSSRDGHQLAELREELAARLRLAEEVEERMRALRGAGDVTREEATYLKYADENQQEGR